MEQLHDLIAECLVKFRDQTLTDADLQQVLDAIDAQPPRQSLLYLQSSSSSPNSRILGISIFEDGQDPEGLNAQGKPLYRSVREAMQDGWRVIKFPETALAMDDRNNYGLGCEFILERWR